MKRLIPTLAMALLATFVLVAPASASFGFEDADVTFARADGSPATGAGSHPFAMTSTLDFNTEIDSESGKEVLEGSPEDLIVELPPGFVANPLAVPACSIADFLSVDEDHPTSNCSDVTALGTLETRAPGETGEAISPVFNLVPSPGTVAKLGFVVGTVPMTLEIHVNPSPPYNVLASLSDISSTVAVADSKLTLWGNPASAAHDAQRGRCAAKVGSCPIAIPERPFLTLPRSCSGPLSTLFKARSREDPGTWVEAEAITHDEAEPPDPLGMTGCSKLGFEPSSFALPTTEQAQSPSDLDVDVDLFDDGLTNPGGLAQSDIKKAVLTLPEEMTINPSVAEGLGTCAPAQYAGETLDPEPGEGCPQASEVGTVEAETPLLEGESLDGRLFVATQDDPGAKGGAEDHFDSIALYMVIRHPGLGILVKLPGKVEPDPVTGQLAIAFGEAPNEIPQLPISHLRFRLGEDGPFITPPRCGTYATKMTFTPWASPANPLTTTSAFEITSGPGGGPCPPETPRPPKVECAGEACQGPAAPPNPPPIPSSSSSSGAAKPKPGCPRGKRKVRRAGKVRCVPKHKRRKRQPPPNTARCQALSRAKSRPARARAAPRRPARCRRSARRAPPSPSR